MALIKCSECGKEISDKATNCPHCGCPISISLNTENEDNKNHKKNIWQNSFFQVFIATLIFLIFFPLMLYLNSENNLDTVGVVLTNDGTRIINDNDFEVIEEQTYGERLEDGSYMIQGKLKQNIEGSYTGLMITFDLLDENGNKIRETQGWLSTVYEGENIWSFIVQGNDADNNITNYRLKSCYGY